MIKDVIWLGTRGWKMTFEMNNEGVPTLFTSLKKVVMEIRS